MSTRNLEDHKKNEPEVESNWSPPPMFTETEARTPTTLKIYHQVQVGAWLMYRRASLFERGTAHPPPHIRANPLNDDEIRAAA